MDQFERRGFHGSRKILVPLLDRMIPFPLPLIDIPKNFRHVFSPTRGNDNEKNDEKFA